MTPRAIRPGRLADPKDVINAVMLLATSPRNAIFDGPTKRLATMASASSATKTSVTLFTMV